MSKRKLNKRQQTRVKAKQQQQLAQSAAAQTGLLISRYGQYADVENASGQFRCHLRQNLPELVVGDQVIFGITAENVPVITAVLPRRSQLQRAQANGTIKLIAANVDLMVIVAAVKPLPATQMIDSYLVAAETLKLQPLLLLNKCDLLESLDAVEALQQRYLALDYPVLKVSANQHQGLEPLQHYLQGHTSVLVGQSGVGKSSLIAKLLPEAKVRTATLTHSGGHGTHVTSAARLYHLPLGGDLIDSPGVREFNLWSLDMAEIAWGFKEFRAWLGQCRFRDCQHLPQDGGCAIQAAASQGLINRDRLVSYQRLLASSNSFNSGKC